MQDMKRIADALELLTAQHEAIAVELSKIPTVEVSGLARALGELADQVTTHLAVEEMFMETLGIASTDSEHKELRLALASILAMDMTSPELSNCIAEFATRWTAHAAEQEYTIFIALAETLQPDVLEDIGLQLGAWSEQSRCLAA